MSLIATLRGARNIQLNTLRETLVQHDNTKSTAFQFHSCHLDHVGTADVEPGEIAQERRSKARTPDKFERLDLHFFENVRNEYLRRAKSDPGRFMVIDARQSPELIWKRLSEIQLNY